MAPSADHLLERGPRGLEATTAGLELYRGAQQVVRQIDRLSESIGAAGSAILGTVSIGLPSTCQGIRLQGPRTADVYGVEDDGQAPAVC